MIYLNQIPHHSSFFRHHYNHRQFRMRCDDINIQIIYSDNTHFLNKFNDKDLTTTYKSEQK